MLNYENLAFWGINLSNKYIYANGDRHSFYEVHGFEFPAKTIFANNSKIIDWMAMYYVYLSLAQLFWPKRCTKCACKINSF